MKTIGQIGGMLVVAQLILWTATCRGSTTATIYYGNSAQFGNSATDPSSLQGFTELRDRWAADGLPTTITNVFTNPVPGGLFLATAPVDTFSGAQVSALQTFVNGGGTFIVSHDGSTSAAMNQILSGLGSSMQFGANQFVGTQTAQVVNNTHPFMKGFSIGDPMLTFAPGVVTGGTALVDYPPGTPIISVESIGAGQVLAVGDFDMLDNLSGLFFPPGAGVDNIHTFWDNMAAVPEPSTFALGIAGLAGLGFVTLRKKFRRV